MARQNNTNIPNGNEILGFSLRLGLIHDDSIKHKLDAQKLSQERLNQIYRTLFENNINNTCFFCKDLSLCIRGKLRGSI